MVLFVLFELTVSAVGLYNLAKGAYSMYCDAEEIKNQYRQHQRTAEEYIRVQNKPEDLLTESQYQNHEDEFLIMDKSMIDT